LIQFLLVRVVQLAQQINRAARFVFINLAQRKSNVKQNPVADDKAVGHQQPDVDHSTHTTDINFCQLSIGIGELNDLSRNSQAHCVYARFISALTLSGVYRALMP